MSEKAKRGRPPTGEAKVAVTLRIRPIVLAAYRAAGDDWRERMEKVLTDGLAPKATARRVLAEAAEGAQPALTATGADLDALAEAVGVKPRTVGQPDNDFRAKIVERIGVPVLQRKSFNPQPKTGKK